MSRTIGIKDRVIAEAMAWLFFFLGFAGGVAIVVLFGRHARIGVPLLLAYEALIIYSAARWRNNFREAHRRPA